MGAALAQDPRVAGVRETEAAMFLRNDETEEAQIPQALNELLRLGGLTIPAFEVLLAWREKIVDGLQHGAQHLTILVAQPRIGEQLLLEDTTGNQAFGDTHRLHPLENALLRNA